MDKCPNCNSGQVLESCSKDPKGRVSCSRVCQHCGYMWSQWNSEPTDEGGKR